MPEENTEGWYLEGAATLGDRIAGARERAGLTQAELARRLGVRLATLTGWEDDRAEPRANQLQTLAGLLGVSMKWLMSGVGEGVPPPPEADRDATLARLLGELREARMAHARAGEKLAKVEARLQALAASA